MKLCNEILSLLEFANPLPKKDSNWYRFAKTFNTGILELDDLAKQLGFTNFKDMDMSISPKSLYTKNSRKFIMALQTSALSAMDMGDSEIGKIIKKL